MAADAVATHNAAWAEALAQALVSTTGPAQPRQVVMAPGSRSTPLVLALVRQGAKVVMHPLLDERVAGFVALGIARATGRAAVLVCTSGSAAAHFLPAVIEAYHGHVPLLILSANRPARLQHCGAPQTCNQRDMLAPYCRYVAELALPTSAVANSWASQAALALHLAESAPAGPAHLDVPFDEPLWRPGPPPSPPPSPPRIVSGCTHPDPAAIAALSHSLTQAKRGLIVCGPRLDPPAASAAIQSLAAHLGWPILTEPVANLASPAGAPRPPPAEAGRPICIDHADALLRDAAFAAEHVPDMVLRCGGLPTAKVVNQWLQQHATGKVVHLSTHGAYSDPDHTLAQFWVADVAATCAALQQSLPARGTPRAYAKRWQQADARAAAALSAYNADHFFAGSATQIVMHTLPAQATLYLANSMAVRDAASFAGHHARRMHILCNRGVNGIDGTLAALLGVALSGAPQPVVALMGDLAFLHDVGALQAARQLQPAAVAVVINNQGGAIFDHLPISAHAPLYTRYFRTPQQADVAALCAASAVGHARATSAQTLHACLHQVLHAGRAGLQVVEVVVPSDPEQTRILYRDAWQAVQGALVAARQKKPSRQGKQA